MEIEREVYIFLDDNGVIDRGLPLWREPGKDMHYVEPGEFFAGLEVFEGRRVQLVPKDGEDKNKKGMKFTIIHREIKGMELPLFVTSTPLDEKHQRLVANYGWESDKSLPFVARTLPHVAGIAVSRDEELFFWYPTKKELYGRVEFMGNELRDYSHSSSNEPRTFFGRIISCYMIQSRGTYYNISYEGDNWRVPKTDFVPFYEFSGEDGKAMVVPSKSRAERMLPTLVMGRGDGFPLIRGFTDSEKVYRIHEDSAPAARSYIKGRFNLDCEVY